MGKSFSELPNNLSSSRFPITDAMCYVLTCVFNGSVITCVSLQLKLCGTECLYWALFLRPLRAQDTYTVEASQQSFIREIKYIPRSLRVELIRYYRIFLWTFKRLCILILQFFFYVSEPIYLLSRL